MLRLSRKVGQRIYVYPKERSESMTVKEFFAGGQLCIDLSELRGSQARIILYVPDKLVIAREELIGEP